MALLSYRDPVTGTMVPLLGGGISQAEADARYLRLTGGTMTGGVNVFANAAARDAAIPAPTFGMMCQLQDTGTIQRHNGYVWVGDTAWTNITPLNGWVIGAPSPQMLMMYDGTVHFQGNLAGVNASSTIAGSFNIKYKPIKTYYGTGHSAGSLAMVTFYLTGTELGISVVGGFPAAVSCHIAATYQADFLAVR